MLTRAIPPCPPVQPRRPRTRPRAWRPGAAPRRPHPLPWCDAPPLARSTRHLPTCCFRPVSNRIERGVAARFFRLCRRAIALALIAFVYSFPCTQVGDRGGSGATRAPCPAPRAAAASLRRRARASRARACHRRTPRGATGQIAAGAAAGATGPRRRRSSCSAPSTRASCPAVAG